MLAEKCHPVKVENNIDIEYFFVSFRRGDELVYLMLRGVDGCVCVGSYSSGV